MTWAAVTSCMSSVKHSRVSISAAQHSYVLDIQKFGLGSAAALVGVTLVGCDDTIVVVLMVVATVASSALYGGSCLNHMDLARNFAGTIAGLLHTIITVTGILAPITVGALTEDNETLAQWNKVFYIAAATSASTFLLYLAFGSVDEQPWNVPQQSSSIKRIGTQQETNDDPKEQVKNFNSTQQDSSNPEQESDHVPEVEDNDKTSTEQNSNHNYAEEDHESIEYVSEIKDDVINLNSKEDSHHNS